MDLITKESYLSTDNDIKSFFIDLFLRCSLGELFQIYYMIDKKLSGGFFNYVPKPIADALFQAMITKMKISL